MHKNEFLNCLNNYLDGNEKVYTVDSILPFVEEFFTKISNNKLEFRDNPDGYIVFDDYILIIEHFEYDATENNKKGSKTRIEENRINKRVDYSVSKQENQIINDQMNVTHSTTNLVKNFIKVFKEHIDNINQYKNQLIKDKIINSSSVIKVMFCCEDKTTFGCLAYDNESQMFPFTVLDINECLNLIRESSIDYISLFNKYQNDKYVKILPNTSEIMKLSLRKNVDQINMIDFKPQVISGTLFIPIPNEKK